MQHFKGWLSGFPIGITQRDVIGKKRYVAEEVCAIRYLREIAITLRFHIASRAIRVCLITQSNLTDTKRTSYAGRDSYLTIWPPLYCLLFLFLYLFMCGIMIVLSLSWQNVDRCWPEVEQIRRSIPRA